MYTGDVGKRSRTIRVDEALDDAVAAEAAERGETVTDVVVRAFEAYVRGADQGQAYVQQAPSGPAVHTGSAASVKEPATVKARPAASQDEPESAASIAAWFRRER